ncbi:hypothetical protein PR048_015856 [Dryococelus australis]|uniref:PiggyBac transposable element-derived protein domain-containing protein n=1 Tax=Dryococelus australis TaxID=614101 RepID=A0ABQ9HIA7_9NEOP|nr:hypothetical protein PR048_015856 [Dryococelus australis]
MEQHRNSRAGETGNPRENPPTSGLVRYHAHLQKFQLSKMYWAKNTRVDKVADMMSRDSWVEIKSNLHTNDNAKQVQKNNPNRDKLFKVRPMINLLLPKFQSIPKDQLLCIDEQIVPFKGESSVKQYNPRKPHKWGYKIFVLCDNKGMILKFTVVISSQTNRFPGLNMMTDTDMKKNAKVDISFPRAVVTYNHFMVGVDLLAGLITYYRISIKSKKNLFETDFLFCRHGASQSVKRKKIPKKDVMDLLGFKSEVHAALCGQGKDMTNKIANVKLNLGKKIDERTQYQNIVLEKDGVGHWYAITTHRQRCKHTACKGITTVKCCKCNRVSLHLAETLEASYSGRLCKYKSLRNKPAQHGRRGLGALLVCVCVDPQIGRE